MVGHDYRPTEEQLTPHVFPDGLGLRIDALADDRVSLVLLLDMIGIYGLRPHEVAQLIWENA